MYIYSNLAAVQKVYNILPFFLASINGLLVYFYQGRYFPWGEHSKLALFAKVLYLSSPLESFSVIRAHKKTTKLSPLTATPALFRSEERIRTHLKIEKGFLIFCQGVLDLPVSFCIVLLG